MSFGISDVTPAECGEEALRLLSASSYDLVICDIVMTGISGIQFLKALRNKDVFPGERHNTPIIMLTAHADETLVIASMKAGANGYLVKPVIPGRLMPLIAKFCHSTLPTLGSCTRTEAAPVSLRR